MVRAYLPGRRLAWVVAAVVVALLCVAQLVGCGESTGSSATGQGSSPPPVPQWVTFATSVTYAQALRAITDLGLQPDLNCTEGWQPNGQRAQFASTHALIVQEAYLTNATDAWAKLAATTGVVRIQSAWAEEAGISVPTDAADVAYICPSPTPYIAQLTHGGNVVYAQAIFEASQTYDDALYIVSDLGLQLADPCYEQRLLAQKSPTWRSMGQENTYPAAHTLLVQTAADTTPVTWQQMLSAMQGVTQVVTPYAAQCS